MEDRLARATLVSAADLGDGVATVIPKSEIEAALANDGEPIQLVLDVAGISDGASRSVPVSWERFDLERLLEQATGDDVTLTFDREALWQAATTDVEAHGIREAIVALAVAATAATGAAGQASAYPSSAFGDSSAAPAQVAGDIAPDDRAVPRPTPVAPPVTGSVSDGTSWAPGPAETAAIAGALALTIAGAFFLVGGRRVRPRPI
jgi:hypothetical protein